ncbi:MAG: minor capsid protein [Methanobrevibacter sp.]|nr:minor capsid protein [Methanobrevibacter sp.]
MATKNNYWTDRYQKQHEMLFDEVFNQTQAELVKYYKKALRETEIDIQKLYAYLLEHSEDGNLIANDWFMYSRYFETMNHLNERMIRLGQREINIYNKNLLKMYERTQQEIDKYSPLTIGIKPTAEQARQAVASIWCADEQHFSDRIWKHKAELKETLEKGILDCIERGAKSQELTNTLVQRFGVSYNQAKRITTTELTHIQNQAAIDRYIDAGIGKYKFVAIGDEATCQICGSMNGMVYDMLDAKTSQNVPPIHPNCRCCLLPYFEED